VRYGGARPSCVLELLWIGVADLVGVTRGPGGRRGRSPPVGPSSGQVDGPQDAGGALGDRTPGGTALQAPPAVIEKVGDLLPTPLKWRTFFARQERNPAYLKAGDVVTASIATEDGALDLGTQRTVVRARRPERPRH
jgi:hypothetical protein